MAKNLFLSVEENAGIRQSVQVRLCEKCESQSRRQNQNRQELNANSYIERQDFILLVHPVRIVYIYSLFKGMVGILHQTGHLCIIERGSHGFDVFRIGLDCGKVVEPKSRSLS